MKDEDFAYEQLRQKRIDNMNLSDRVRAGSEAAPWVIDEIHQLEKQIVMLRGWLEKIARSRVGQCDSIAEELFKREAWADEALAATQDLSGLVLCDADPFGYASLNVTNQEFRLTKQNYNGHGTPLYKARKQP